MVHAIYAFLGVEISLPLVLHHNVVYIDAYMRRDTWGRKI